MGDKLEPSSENANVEGSPLKSFILRQYQGYFKDKSIIVTGSRQGLGRELVKLFHAEGAKVYAVSRFVENLKTLKERYPGIVPIACNLKSWKDTEEALTEAVDGPVDMLVNNAEELQKEEFLQATPYSIDRALDINVKGMLIVSKFVANNMINAGRGGSIVTISSIASVNPSIATGLFGYCASKAASDMITRCMAVELGPYNIRVNSVNPTIITNDFRKEIWIGTDDSKAQSSKLASLTPLGRFALMEDVVQTVAFLLSEKSKMITGQAIKVDGGYGAR